MPRRMRFAALAATWVMVASGPVLAESLALDVAKASITYSFPDKTALDLQLTETGTADFAAFTERHVGKLVDLRIDGKVMMSPKIVEPITGGKLTVSGQFAPGKLEGIAKKISAGAVSVDVETHY